MVPLRKSKVLKGVFQVLILVISVFLINACSLQSNTNLLSPPKKVERSHANKPNHSFKWKLPISIPDGEFFKVGGWLSDDDLVYITNNEQTSTLYRYQLSSGKSKVLFKSEYPIGDVQISPSKKNILIQSAPSSYEGKITIIDAQGNEKYSQIIPSYQLAFEWNPYQETQVLISKFQEDWTFQVLLVDFEQKITKELSLPQPFLKWIGKDELGYLNWDHNQQKLFAPLVFRSLGDASVQTIFPKVFQFSAFKNMMMTITVKTQENTKANYSFYDQKLHLIYDFTIPQLTKFSDWLVPYYDFNEAKQQFITLRPLKSTEADTYKEGFQLVVYHLNSKNSTVLLDGLENEPISLSPSGDACLYGNRFEKIIDLPTKKITNIVKE
ncbi:MAG: hypothetical protein Q8935_19675 [Bacillota bacterium]|nr:hypothetical protein [Bacillota bacterium]